MSLLATIPLVAEINTCSAMFVREIVAPHEGVVRVVLEEGGSAPMLNPNEFADGVLSEADLTPKLLPRRVFELRWDACVSYVATDETYAPSDRTGDRSLEEIGWVQSFRESSFLRFVTDTTYSVEHHNLTLLHVRVATYNWIVDVVSIELPQVLKLESEYR